MWIFGAQVIAKYPWFEDAGIRHWQNPNQWSATELTACLVAAVQSIKGDVAECKRWHSALRQYLRRQYHTAEEIEQVSCALDQLTRYDRPEAQEVSDEQLTAELAVDQQAAAIADNINDIIPEPAQLSGVSRSVHSALSVLQSATCRTVTCCRHVLIDNIDCAGDLNSGLIQIGDLQYLDPRKSVTPADVKTLLQSKL